MTMSIPSPPLEWNSFPVGPFDVHVYALWILAGIFLALWLTTRRWVERGGNAEVVAEVTFWAIPFGIVGGRLYHVVSTPGPYFGADGNPWEIITGFGSGLGIWGAVALGTLGAYIGARRHGVSFIAYLDAVAPAVLIAQGVGRLGNYFNHELYGSATTLPWGLEIDPSRMPVGDAAGTLYHPTFLYEMMWNFAGAALIIYLDKKLDLRGGQVFWLYVGVYTIGRTWIETLRIDEAVLVGGLRINVWVSIAVFITAVVFFVLIGRKQVEHERVERNQLAASHTQAKDVADAA